MSGSVVVDCSVGFFLSAMNVKISKKLDRFVAHVDVKRLVSDNELDGESKYCLPKATVKEAMESGIKLDHSDEDGSMGA